MGIALTEIEREGLSEFCSFEEKPKEKKEIITKDFLKKKAGILKDFGFKKKEVEKILEEIKSCTSVFSAEKKMTGKIMAKLNQIK